MKTLVSVLKKWHILPVYRKDILEYALENYENYPGEDYRNYPGLCALLRASLAEFGIHRYTYAIFPLFNIYRAIHFNAYPTPYWWEKEMWDTGRLDFLKWLYEQYKDDKSNLRKL